MERDIVETKMEKKSRLFQTSYHEKLGKADESFRKQEGQLNPDFQCQEDMPKKDISI